MEGAVQRRERPKRSARNRLARCAVRHAVPARYRNRPLPLRFQRQPDPQHRPADGHDQVRVRQTGQDYQMEINLALGTRQDMVKHWISMSKDFHEILKSIKNDITLGYFYYA